MSGLFLASRGQQTGVLAVVADTGRLQSWQNTASVFDASPVGTGACPVGGLLSSSCFNVLGERGHSGS